MTLTQDLDGARTVLLQTSSMSGSRDVCSDLLLDGVDEPNVLFVTFTRQGSTCVDQVADAPTANVGVITVGDATANVDDPAVETASVSAPSDLTGLGIEIGQFLTNWDAPIVVCFDSLTSLLQYVDFETAYEFLHAVTGQLQAADARAHFHVDPGAHDAQAIAGITSLFDASVEVGEETSVRTRDVIQ
ncbi:hypothetical protein ACKVMT_09880 [Halobacteriales archaeon Cl-PHB]